MYNTAFSDFALDVSTEVEVGISCDDGQWFHCIACIWWERNTSSTVSRSLLILPQQLDTMVSHDYHYSRLNQLERNYAKKIQSELWEMIYNLWGHGLGKALAWESTVPLQVPTHRATCFAAQVVFVLGASLVFSCSAKVETCHDLHQWTVMWRTAVQPLPPKNLRRFASRDLDGVFGFRGSTRYLQLQQFHLQLFDFWVFEASVRTNKRSRALSMP